MAKFLIKWVIYTLSLFAVSHIVAGITIANWETTIVAALVLGLINTFIRPFFIIFTLPLNVLSMGILTLFINGFMFYMAAHFVKGFSVAGFWNAFWAAILFSIITSVLNVFFSRKNYY
ncbi:MAG: phage holin family protein [Candidatus Omnitrophota bacterium]|jgi:putative membrane protein